MTRGYSRLLACLVGAGLSGACAPNPAEQIPIIDISLGDYFFHGPDTIPAGRVTFRLNVVGPDHHVMDLLRLDQGKTLKDLMAAGESAYDSSWVTSVGGGVTATEGNSPSYTMHLVPGRYVMLCYFGAADHVPHYAKGMVKEFMVAGPERPVAGATGELQVELVDYDFKFSAPLQAGSRPIRVINTSKQGHEMIVARLKDGFTLEQARAHEDSTAPKGPSPWEGSGGVGDLAPGDTIVMTGQLKLGTYQLYCYFQNAGEKQNHYKLGMHKIITVN